MRQLNFFRKTVTTRKNQRARKQYAGLMILVISITLWANSRFGNCVTITKRSKATIFHCRNSITSCSITACHLFAFFAKSCSKTRANGIKCSEGVKRVKKLKGYKAQTPSNRIFLDFVTFCLRAKAHHHGISLRSRKNFPVNFCGASVASHTMVFAPSSTERAAPCPPISVRTHPGQTEFTAKLGNAAASCDVTPLSAVLEMQ